MWAEGDEVLNVNEAHAYASCSDCVTVAVAFQVVLIMDDAQVVVPQNLAVAANYDCYRCITAAIASQLVLSVEEEPGEEELLALGEVWDRLTEFARQHHVVLAHRDRRPARRLQGRDRRDPGGGAELSSPRQSSVTTGTTSPSLAPSTTGPPPQQTEQSSDGPAAADGAASDGPAAADGGVHDGFILDLGRVPTPPSSTSEDSLSTPDSASP